MSAPARATDESALTAHRQAMNTESRGSLFGEVGYLAGRPFGYGWPPRACALPIAIASAQVVCSPAATTLLGRAPHLRRRRGLRCPALRFPALQAPPPLGLRLPGCRSPRLALQFGCAAHRTGHCGGCVLPLA